ncbi:uncharacterized protein V1513DRAFT_434066 [Lipomyces chichibuensis]|uniref:uncharacterized protein n=1 Tax=Lipomyces chichibuensis TaxID=1546026 RepID=UPI0033441183
MNFTITTNVVSTFLLGLLLLPKLKESATKYNTKPHLTLVTCEMHFLTTISTGARSRQTGKHKTLFEAMFAPNTANMGERCQVSSKLLEIFVVCAPASPGYPVVINLVNPGFCRIMPEATQLLLPLIRFLMHARNSEVASRTVVHGAGGGEETHGQYLSDCRVSPVTSFVERANEFRGEGRKERDADGGMGEVER